MREMLLNRPHWMQEGPVYIQGEGGQRCSRDHYFSLYGVPVKVPRPSVIGRIGMINRIVELRHARTSDHRANPAAGF
jgi:hypothetical protein